MSEAKFDNELEMAKRAGLKVEVQPQFVAPTPPYCERLNQLGGRPDPLRSRRFYSRDSSSTCRKSTSDSGARSTPIIRESDIEGVTVLFDMLMLREMGSMRARPRLWMSWPLIVAKTRFARSRGSRSRGLIPRAVGSPVAPLAIKQKCHLPQKYLGEARAWN